MTRADGCVINETAVRLSREARRPPPVSAIPGADTAMRPHEGTGRWPPARIGDDQRDHAGEPEAYAARSLPARPLIRSTPVIGASPATGRHDTGEPRRRIEPRMGWPKPLPCPVFLSP